MGEEASQISQRLTGMLRSAGTRMLNVFYPPSCAGCGRLAQNNGALCPACWSEVRFIERPYCEILGTPFTHDLGAGFLSAEAIANPPVFSRARAAVSHEGVCKRLVHGLKYNDRLDLAPILAGWMQRAGGDHLAQADVIVPVPLHRMRLFTRRFNQSAELARHIARLAGKPLNVGDLRRVRRTIHQVGLGEKARADNVRGAFAVTDEGKLAFSGRKIVLVDDVYTTGATVSAATKALMKAGAAEVTVLVFSMALAEPI